MNKTYEIELQRTSYITYTIEAPSVDVAEKLVWKQLENDYSYGHSAHWNINNIMEVFDDNTCNDVCNDVCNDL